MTAKLLAKLSLSQTHHHQVFEAGLSDIFPSMDDLAAEIIVQIFKNLDTRFTITALARANRRCYQVWKDNAATISDAILKKEIHCYPDAVHLIYCQHLKDEPELAFSRDYSQTLRRNKLLLQNASVVSGHMRQIVTYTDAGQRQKPKLRVHRPGKLSGYFTIRMCLPELLRILDNN